MASNTKSDKIVHPEHDMIALAAPVNPEDIRDIPGFDDSSWIRYVF